MHSFLIVSKNKQTALDYVIGKCKKNQIDKFDINLLAFEKAIGIEDIRNVQKKLFLKPIKSKTKAVILEGSNGFTIEAQNALLKILEEPPANTVIYITSQNKELLLPTILSRCKIIEIKDKSLELSQQEVAQYTDVLISFPQNTMGERLRLALDIAKNKDEVIPWLEKMIHVARQKLIYGICHSDPDLSGEESPGILRRFASQDDNGETSQYLNILISLTKTYTILKTTNVNPRLALENLFLNI
jgi:hypothetical protein